MRPEWLDRSLDGNERKRCSARLRSSATPHCRELKAVSNADGGFVSKTERIRMQRAQFEVRRLISQPTELRPEIEMGEYGYIRTRAVQKHPSRLRPNARGRSVVDGANDGFRAKCRDSVARGCATNG